MGTVRTATGGLIGNPPFVPTPEQHAQARELGRLHPEDGERLIAARMGISRSTLREHFTEDMLAGRSEVVTAIASQMVSRALNADAVGPDGKPIAKGDFEAQKFMLIRFAGWTGKHEVKVTTPPPEKVIDLDGIPVEDLREALPILRAILERMRVARTQQTSEPRRIN